MDCAWVRLGYWLLGLDDGYIGLHYTIECVLEFSMIKSFFRKCNNQGPVLEFLSSVSCFNTICSSEFFFFPLGEFTK